MSPHWYDLLDVDRNATSEEIRAAWKSSIADLDPSDRRFRVLNEAAELLLDPERRAAYDATLAEQEEAEAQHDGGDEDDEAPDAEEATSTEGPSEAPATFPTRRRGTRLALLALLALVTLAVVCATIFAWTRPGPVDESAAQSAAEVAVIPLLSYDYRTLDADAAAARSYMTDDYRTKYDQLFEVIQEFAPTTETVVTVEIVASGVVRSSDRRVDVLLFVNRPTSRKKPTPLEVYRDQATLRMVLVDGEWLVDDVITTPAAA
ncbi:DnaJ domain-containing protein [Nocardioides psychrotolerans]|uniref:DnaJ domain-containing protein n=1 Tax=Nocardioides psychrotolerans TaxID=1005945 RepID=UPI003138078A